MRKTMLLVLVLMVSSVFSDVKDLSAKFYGGKTYITFTEEADTAGKTYNVYRSLAPIQSVSGLTPIATLPCRSGYDRRYKFHHIISDTGAPLSDSTGLFVYTPKKDTIAYYAVTVVRNGTQDPTVVAGVNALQTGVAEAYWESPLGILREIESGASASYRTIWHYFYWMDYENWSHSWDYYGGLYTLTMHHAMNPNTVRNVPLKLWLHGHDGGTYPAVPPITSENGYLIMTFRDNKMCYWYGGGNHAGIHVPHAGDTIVGYTESFTIAAMRSVLKNSRFSIDSNRVYLSGQSMGGGGTITTGMHYPQYFAAIQPIIGRIHYSWNTYSSSFWANRSDVGGDISWGAQNLEIPAPSGYPIYRWMDAGWLARQYRHTEFPPVVNLHGCRDPLHLMYTHRYLYKTFSETRNAVWGHWANVGHSNPGATGTIPGGYERFVRNEAYPAFTNCNQDDNYGKADSSIIDSAGFLNSSLDWGSVLHRTGIPGDSLIDSGDSLAITFRAAKAGAVVDITPRRLQLFAVAAGRNYAWKSYYCSDNSIADSGIVSADSVGLITILQLSIDTSGTRLVVKAGAETGLSSALVKGGTTLFTAGPNPFHSSIAIRVSSLGSFSGVTVRIFDLQGKLVRRLEPGETVVTWDGRNENRQLVCSGVYLCRFESSGSFQQRLISFLR